MTNRPATFLTYVIALELSVQLRYFWTRFVRLPAATMTAQCPIPNAVTSNTAFSKLSTDIWNTIPKTGARKAKVHGPNPIPNSRPKIKDLTYYNFFFVWSIRANVTHNSPINIKDTPSIIHSIVMIRLLSVLISPNPLTTDFVGNKCAIPQIMVNAEPM